MSDEEDYMSEAFLAKCVPEDVRPGLKRSHATKRDHELQKKKSECDVLRKTKKSKAELESEKREEGLQKSLDSSNKGFALLAKMGYKAGDSLGKSSGKSNTGIVEPIGIEVKNNRGGLGRETAKKQIKETKAKLRSLKKTSNSVPFSAEDFRASQSKKLKAKKVEGDLYRAQKATRQLDQMSKEFTEPIESWFWPKVIKEPTEETDIDLEEPKIKDITNEDEEQVNAENNLQEIIETEEEEEVEIPPDEMLKIITEYLRTDYLFCIWCGITFENADDLNSNCPGNSRDDHDD